MPFLYQKGGDLNCNNPTRTIQLSQHPGVRQEDGQKKEQLLLKSVVSVCCGHKTGFDRDGEQGTP